MTRTSVTVAGAYSPASNSGPISGRLLLVGKTTQGVNTPVVVRSLSDFVTNFGGRTAAPLTYDVVDSFFGEGGAEVVMVRALGPSAVKATISLDSGKIVVTAKQFGAHANGWTAEYTASTKTLTVVAGSVTETFVGTDAASLIAAVDSDYVTAATSGTLPSADVAATALATGADDYANASWSTLLAKFTSDYGPGAVAVAGEPYSTVGSALASHADAFGRVALVSFAQGATASAATSAMATIGAYTGASSVAACWPHLTKSSLAGSYIDPVGFVAGVRARQHALSGPGRSLLRSASTSVTGLTPEIEATEAEATAAISAKLNMVRTFTGLTQLDGWATADPTFGIANLVGAQFADLVDAVRYAAEQIAAQYVGTSLESGDVVAFNGSLLGMLAGIPGPTFYPAFGPDGIEVDPGYVVDTGSEVNPPENLAAGQLAARITLRLTPTAETVSIAIAAGDANLAI